MAKTKSPPSRAASVASFWCVHLRTAQHWLAHPGRPAGAGLPATPPLAALDEPATMLAWVRSLPSASQAKLTRTFRARCDAFRIALERGQPLTLPPGAKPPHTPPLAPPAPPPGHPAPPAERPVDPDWLAFQASLTAPATAPAGTPGAAPHAPAHPSTAGVDLASLRLRCAYADYKIGLAQQRGDHPSVREWTETLRYLAGVIHDEELRAQRLNREIGDTLPRADAARLIRALPYWLLRGIDRLHAALDRPLAAAAAAGPLHPEHLRTLLEPHALAALLHTPLVRAAQVTSPNALPPWALAEFRAAHAATLEDGAALWDELYATPVPKHPSDSQISNPQISDPSVNAITGPAPVADSAPPVSATNGHEPAGAATASHSPLGSVPNQTA